MELKLKNNTKNIFQCSDKTLISSFYVLNNKTDCKYGSDEFDCTDMFPATICSLFQYKIAGLYHKLPAAFRREYPKILCNIAYSNITVGKNMNNSSMFSLCIYELDVCGNIASHSDGRHLIDCADYQCKHKYFKCPGYYCIPWRYVCDHMWQCPRGLDERDCSNRTACPNMFKCTLSAICINRESTCDKIMDCPHGDDEFLCFPSLPECPSDCSCLAYAIHCSYFQINLTGRNMSFPYILVSIKNSKFPLVSNILQLLNETRYLFLSKTGISCLCQCLNEKINNLPLKIFSFPYNEVKHISAKCFKHSMMQLLNASRNRIKNLQRLSFQGLVNLTVLDLSFNLIAHIPDILFNGLLKMKFLNIMGNPLFGVTMDIFSNSHKLENILTENFKLCCLKPSPITNCTAKPQWPNSCSRLLDDDFAKSMMWLVGLVGLLLNISAFISTQMNSAQEKSNYTRIVLIILFGDALMCYTLITIASADAYYGETYLQNELKWRSHIACYMSCTGSLASNIISVYGIHLMTASRYFVVKHPLSSLFLRSRFIVNQVIILIIGSFTFTGSLVLVYTLSPTSQAGMLPSGLCMLVGNIDQSIVSKLVTFIVMASQAFSVFSIPSFYILLLQEVKKNKNKMEAARQRNTNQEDNIQRMVIVSLTDLMGWIPCSILLCLTLVWKDYPVKMLIWTTAIVLPLNGIINPFVFVHSQHITKNKPV